MRPVVNITNLIGTMVIIVDKESGVNDIEEKVTSALLKAVSNAQIMLSEQTQESNNPTK
ncbi:hypothetical protein OIU83_17625 [Flavobacterium sp. LS1R49]|uniref:Uncharacterized protein n=1 Tax=Flavobacterium shii TaxID=2987687 RepID=A0A9X3BYZ6_9FLAO|nr:hypothetical protein [Flavobacterium shii]MCV9929485.1 hypothetical protein [Flavobacterium shii]